LKGCLGGGSLFILGVSLKKNNLKSLFTLLARINKSVLPSFTKKRLDLANAKKWQLAIIGWRYYVLKKALD
jgi:hypothetical protein